VSLVFDLSSKNASKSTAGGKAVGLHALLGLSLEVPPGFVISSAVFKQHVDAVRQRMDSFDGQLRTAAKSPLAASSLETCREIKEQIQLLPIPLEAQKAIRRKLRGYARNDMFAVRSSATVEDSEHHSWAGQFESVLEVENDCEAVASAVKLVWASLFAPRALNYAQLQGVDFESISMAVIVQKLVPHPDFAGVVFTRHPTESKDVVYVEAVTGYGNRLVSGSVTPVAYNLSRQIPLRILKGPASFIPPPVLMRLWEAALLIEKACGRPQDIEWAIESNHVFILQTRPISVLQDTPPDSGTSQTQEVIVSGLPASSGRADGPAALVFNIEDATRVSQEDIIVAPMTNPDMVPYIRRAAGIVTDVGGMICHTAIVAREMHVPCVVGTAEATRRIRSRRRVTVDGDLGKVYGGIVVQAGRKDHKYPLRLFTDRALAFQSNSATAGEGLQICFGLSQLSERIGDSPLLVLPDFLEAYYLAQAARSTALTESNVIQHLTQNIISSLHTIRRAVYVVLPRYEPLASELIRALGPARKECAEVVLVSHLLGKGPTDRHFRCAYLPLVRPQTWSPRALDHEAAVEHLFIYKEQNIGLEADVPDYVERLAPKTLWAVGSWQQDELAALSEVCSEKLVRIGRNVDWKHLQQYVELRPTASFFGHSPELHRLRYPYPPRTGPWWPDNWQHEWVCPDEEETVWGNVRPEIVNSPLTKSLIVQGIESIPLIFGFPEVGPLYTKWRKCRKHIPTDKLDRIRMMITEKLLNADEDLWSYISELHGIYRTWGECTSSVAATLDSAREHSTAGLIEMFKNLWRFHERFFALCFLIQTIGDDLVWPVIQRMATLAAELAGSEPHAQVANHVTRVLAHPPERTLSSHYLESLQQLREVYERLSEDSSSDATAQWRHALENHLAEWYWMRDRDLFYQPLDSPEEVERLVEKLEPAIRAAVDPSAWWQAVEALSAVFVSCGMLERFGHVLMTGVHLHIERENHHLIWVRNVDVMRRIVLMLGSRLCNAGLLSSQQDVFFLQLPELFALCEGRLDGYNEVSRLIENRKKAFLSESRHAGADQYAEDIEPEEDYY